MHLGFLAIAAAVVGTIGSFPATSQVHTHTHLHTCLNAYNTRIHTQVTLHDGATIRMNSLAVRSDNPNTLLRAHYRS